MLKLNVNRMFTVRGVRQKTGFLMKAGLSRSMANRIAAGDVKRLSSRQLELLCLALHCSLNDLYDWIPDKPELVNETNPLVKLIRSDTIYFDIANFTIDIPVEKLNVLRERLALLKEELKAT